jgi:hypothetical protein
LTESILIGIGGQRRIRDLLHSLSMALLEAEGITQINGTVPAEMKRGLIQVLQTS